MALFRKKPDLIGERARALSAEISALESQIRKYESTLAQAPEPRAGAASRQPENPGRASDTSHARHGLKLETVDQRPLTSIPDPRDPQVHLNEFGVRKYDLPALVAKIRGLFNGPTTSNPKLVNYLAAGGIQGLRPLRYEKRVARNRFVFLVTLLFCLLLGIWMVLRPH